MPHTSSASPAALDLIAELARNLSLELDFHYDVLDETEHHESLSRLTAAMQMLRAAGRTPPEIVTHVLARASGRYSASIQ